jgi:hypothetical protein
MLIHSGVLGRVVPPLFQQALEPNVHEHYVELHRRTYRLFVLQTELILIQYCRRREIDRRNYAFECESAERKMRS